MPTPEEILRNALAHVPDESPHPGHEERFAQRLARQRSEKKGRVIPLWAYLSVAAASVAALIITLVVSEIKKTNEEFSRMRLSDLSYEMARVESFYEQRLNQKMPVLSSEDEMMNRLQSQLTALELEYDGLEAALAQSPSNQPVVDAMVSNYRYRLQIMELMQRYVEISNNVKKKKNEGIDL